MRFAALATDYDGTLAYGGVVAEGTLTALERLRASGRRLVLVTGRELRDLQSTFSRLDLFDIAVMENGGTLYFPAEGRELPLADPPPAAFLKACRERGVRQLSAGRVIVATVEAERAKVLDAIHSLGLELQVVFNKGSMMVLPAGVNKASGLEAALQHLLLSRHNIVGVGDAENDHAFLNFCECGAAVANALPALKARADLQLKGDDGAGVVELIDALLRDDLAGVVTARLRHEILLGTGLDGNQVCFRVHGKNLLIAGSSGGGKTSMTKALVEGLMDAEYQVCVLDPEGDYKALGDAVLLGDPKSPPAIDAILKVLEKPERSVAANLIGVPFDDRPAFFEKLMGGLRELSIRAGRPHWTVVDEAHHLLPAGRVTLPLPGRELLNLALITVKPEHTAFEAIALTDALIAVGSDPDATARAWGVAAGVPAAPVGIPLQRGQAALWRRDAPGQPVIFQIPERPIEHARHNRKYAAGELSPERSFYFRGPEGKLKLRADNLTSFLRMADGVDDDTWMHHLRQGDYSRWMRTEIHNDELAAEAEAVERDDDLDAQESRERIQQAITKRFTIAE
jgi:hydroxymethylpyrimidine pyrophosphatase-like HAD family hydrolase